MSKLVSWHGGFMISRRKFLAFGGVAAGVATVPPSLLAFRATTAERLSDPALPPSLAQLKSRKSEAIPITREERKERQEQARQLMSENALDAIVLMEGTSLRYFTGIRWWGGERMFALALPVKGEAFYVCPAFEEGRAHEQIAGAPDGEHPDVRTWQEDESPYQRVAQGLKERGIATGRLGIEETVRFFFADGIAKAAPQATLISATPVTAGCRRIKSTHELALMSLANQVTLAVYEAVYHALREGMTQHDVGELIAAAYGQMGFPGDASVQVGEYSALPHGSRTPQVIHEGSIVMIDDGCDVEGYQSDITRTFVFGKAPEQVGDKMRKVFDIVHRAQAAALAAARPGAECGSVDAAARKVITDAGYGPDYKYFTHRLGHGIGMDGHEWPYLVRGNTTKLAPNMTFSDEPGIYIPGEFGIRLEDDMHITENGAELFTPQSPSLEDPFGKMRPVSPAQLVQVFVAGCDAVERRSGFIVFHDVVLDTRLLGLRKDLFPVDDSAPDRGHVLQRIPEILATRSGNGWKLLNVLDVDQGESSRIAIKVLQRVSTGDSDPAQVELHLDQVRVAVCK
jgi:Xaa-Pro dipeptidase